MTSKLVFLLMCIKNLCKTEILITVLTVYNIFSSYFIYVSWCIIMINDVLSQFYSDDWCTFNPRTNVFWLHYTVDKLVSECHYKKSKDWRHKRYLSLLKKIRENLLSCRSCRDFIKSFNETYGRPITDLSAPSDTK